MEPNRRHRYQSTHLQTPTFDKEAKNVKWKKERTFNKWCWHNFFSFDIFCFFIKDQDVWIDI